MKTLTKKLAFFALASIVLTGFQANYALASEEEFSDVGSGEIHYVAINYLKSIGLVTGYEDNTFKPDSKINRAEALKMITLACGLEVGAPEQVKEEKDTEETDEDTKDKAADTEETPPAEPIQPFLDTPIDAWYTNYLIAAKDKGVINGYEDGSFKPDQNINLVEALKIYFECLDGITYPEGEQYLYADTAADAWYIKYTNYASSRSLLTVNLDNKIYPDQEVTRGSLSEIIYRNIVADEGYGFGKATYYGGVPDGENNFTAAHKTLPLGTMVEVTGLANNKSVTVEITDRGPYGAGRVLDLSSEAFEQLASLGTGVINVRYKVISNQ
jgi:hypothetical protein